MEEQDCTLQISAGPPELLGPLDEARVHIRLALEPEPNQVWIDIFNNLPAGVGHWPDIEHPEASPTGIDGYAQDDLVEKYVAHIRERVAAANRDYNADVAPKLAEAAARQKAEADKQARRLDEVRRRLESL